MVRRSNYSLDMRKSLLALLVVMAALPARAQESVHVMQPKQTLYAVSRMYGVPVKTLLQINNFANPNKIKVGTAIKLPAGTKAAVNSPAATLATQSVPESNTTTAAKPAEEARRRHRSAGQEDSGGRLALFRPLQVDWSNWRTMAGSLVAPTLNKQNSPSMWPLTAVPASSTSPALAAPGKPGNLPPKPLSATWSKPPALIPSSAKAEASAAALAGATNQRQRC